MEAPARPLADSVHFNKQGQRIENHPTMPGTRSGKGKGSKKAPPPARSATAKNDEVDEDKEKAELKLKLARMQKRMKLDRTGASKSTSGTQSAMQNCVRKCTKTKLWKICKFIKSPGKLDKGVKFVMESLDLQELDGLEGQELVEAQETWKAQYSPDVRTALNKQRNYCQQELREVMERECFKPEKEDEFPNEKEILDVVLRNKLDENTPDEERERFEMIFDNYWNVLVPKVAGHSSWGPAKRHYQLLSSGKEDPDDQACQPYVSASDEAFIAVLWLNCYKKWWYKEQMRREKKNVDPNHADMQTPYTDSKAGQKKFGGWNKAGIEKYDELCKLIKENRKTEKEYIQGVEEAALERIRKQEKTAEKEEKRKTKKRTKKQQDGFSDDDDDEDDYDNW